MILVKGEEGQPERLSDNPVRMADGGFAQACPAVLKRHRPAGPIRHRFIFAPLASASGATFGSDFHLDLYIGVIGLRFNGIALINMGIIDFELL